MGISSVNIHKDECYYNNYYDALRIRIRFTIVEKLELYFYTQQKSILLGIKKFKCP